MDRGIQYIRSALEFKQDSNKMRKRLLLVRGAVRDICFTGDSFTKVHSKESELPLLHHAVVKNNLTVVKFIFSLLQGKEINLEQTADGYTPLQYATISGFHHVAEYLIEKGARIQSVLERHYPTDDDYGEVIVPIYYAIDHNRKKVFKLIMDTIPPNIDLSGVVFYLLHKCDNLAMISIFVESEYVRNFFSRQEQRELFELAFKVDNYEAFEIIARGFDTETLDCLECDFDETECPHQEFTLRDFLTFTGNHSTARREQYYYTAFPSDVMPDFEQIRPEFDISCPASPDPCLP